MVSVIRTAKMKLADKEKFPSRVMKELRNLPGGEEDIVPTALREGRTDLRDNLIVTVDPRMHVISMTGSLLRSVMAAVIGWASISPM